MKRTGMDRVRGSPWFLFRGCFLRGILYNTGGYTLDIRGSEIRDSVLHKKHVNGQQRSKEGEVGEITTRLISGYSLYAVGDS